LTPCTFNATIDRVDWETFRETTNSGNPDLLSLEHIDRRYGGVKALRGASFSLRAGEVHALMGENGAGKSTLGRIMAGVVRANAGEIRIDGRIVSISTPQDAQRLGISIIHQELDLFPHLTVGENMVIGNLHFRDTWPVSHASIEAFCRPYLTEVGLDCRTQTQVQDLLIGQRQLIAVARAMSMNARVLIMDEPTSALPEDAAQRLFGLIDILRSRGVAIVYVSHKMEETFRISDRITVLRDGQTIDTRETRATTADDIIQMMVGRAVDTARQTSQARTSGRMLLRVEGLSTRTLQNICFDLNAGEVLGIAGLVGSGRAALGESLVGLDRLTAGKVQLRGCLITPQGPADALRHGLALLPMDRKLQGLMMQMNVRENGTMSVLPKICRGGIIRTNVERSHIEPLIRRLRLKCNSPNDVVSTLSGGNQQKTLLARMALADPDVLFLCDPARGVDVGAKEDIYALIAEWAHRGKGILLVSSELPELLRLSDRVLVLNQGRVAAIYSASEATPERIMAAATGPIAA